MRAEHERGGSPVAARPPTFAVPRAVSPRPVSPNPDLGDPALYFNRELSWLDFNWRVLHQALDARVPLFERVRFLAITQNNLDEFFRTRVGGLKRQLAAGVTQLSPDGRTPAEQLELIRQAARPMQEAMDAAWNEALEPGLREEGIVLRRFASLPLAERRRLRRHFRSSVYPVLTPLAVDPGHPFPFVSDLSLSLAVGLFHPVRPGLQFARVKVPTGRGRWLPLSEKGHFITLEQLVAQHMDELFPGTRVDSVHAFRIARNADLARDEEVAEDLLQMISEELRERRFAPAVRLEVEAGMPDRMIDLLCDELDLDPEQDVYRVHGLIGYGDLNGLTELERPDLRFSPWEPPVPEAFGASAAEEPPSVFQILRAGDRLVHHPYDAFSGTVLRFLDEAADDPAVLAIKMTLYRTSEHSPVVRALVRAAERGKQVAALVEVTARFEEQRNIDWGLTLERAGVHVTYGLVGLKTHAKVILVVREDEDGMRTYCHFGTGNYHVATARIYTDLGFFTSDPQIGEDTVRLFHYLTGHAPEQRYGALIVAPRDMRSVLEGLVERERAHARAGRPAGVALKMNALDDVGVIRCLYAASGDGVPIDFVVRGHTRLRPELGNVSATIRLRSLVGRFLEHDRIFWFENGGDPDVLIGSADLRRRNLEERVEVLVRVHDATVRARLRHILDSALADNRSAWRLDADGHYRLTTPASGEVAHEHHAVLMVEAMEGRAGTPREEAGPARAGDHPERSL